MLALDGVISVDVERGVRFHETTGLEARDAEALARTVQLRVLRWFARRGLLDPSTAADMRTWRGTGGCFASSMLSVFDRRAGRPLRQSRALGEKVHELEHSPCGGQKDGQDLPEGSAVDLVDQPLESVHPGPRGTGDSTRNPRSSDYLPEARLARISQLKPRNDARHRLDPTGLVIGHPAGQRVVENGQPGVALLEQADASTQASLPD